MNSVLTVRVRSIAIAGCVLVAVLAAVLVAYLVGSSGRVAPEVSAA